MSLKIIRYLTLASLVVLLASCSYGFFNLAGDRGEIEIGFEIIGASFKNVDRVEFELTPPVGMTRSVRRKLENDSVWQGYDNVDTGNWSVKTILYTGFEVVQEFSHDIEVLTDKKTWLRIDAIWVSTEYVIKYESSQYEINDSAVTDVNYASAITLDQILVKPGIIENYHSGERFHSVYTSILGSDFNDNISFLKLIYPNGTSYEFGYQDYYSRSIPMSHFIENDDRVEIKWLAGSENDILNGDYRLKIADFNGGIIIKNEVLAMDFDSFLPRIVDNSIPQSLPRSSSHDFVYEFPTAVTGGTMLMYLIDRNNPNEIIDYDYPNAPHYDIALSSSSGTFTVQPNQLTIGKTYQLMLVAVEKYSSDPVGDAALAGLESTDLRTSGIVDTINAIYGENTGYVFCHVLEFTVSP